MQLILLPELMRLKKRSVCRYSADERRRASAYDEYSPRLERRSKYHDRQPCKSTRVRLFGGNDVGRSVLADEDARTPRIRALCALRGFEIRGSRGFYRDRGTTGRDASAAILAPR